MPRPAKQVPVDDTNFNVTPIDDVNVIDPTPFQPQGIDQVFRDQPTEQQEVATEKTVTISESQFQKLLNDMNDLKQKVNQDGIIDPMNTEKQKKIVRVAFYSDDSGQEFLITDLRAKTMVDGSVVTTWEKGRDELTEKVITWCRPIMINIENGVTFETDLRYDHYAAMIRTVPCEVVSEETKRVDVTGIPEVVEVTSYQEANNGRVRPFGSGQKIKTTVIAIQTTFTVSFRDKEYKVGEKVINIK